MLPVTALNQLDEVKPRLGERDLVGAIRVPHLLWKPRELLAIAGVEAAVHGIEVQVTEREDAVAMDPRHP